MAKLDKMRTELMASSAVVLQRYARGFVARHKYQRTRRAVITLQVRFCESAQQWPQPHSINRPSSSVLASGSLVKWKGLLYVLGSALVHSCTCNLLRT